MIAWLVEALIASALLMALVLAIRAPVRRIFGPQVAYALWALPVLRFAMPPLPAAWREQTAMPISRAGEAVSGLVLPAAEPVSTATVARLADPVATVATLADPAATASMAVSWSLVAGGLWAAGALAFFLYHFTRHRRFCRALLAAARTVDEIGGVRVVETPAAAGPLAFGLSLGGVGRRFVAFPDDFADRYDADERALALAHELGHHQRGDLFANWVALAVLALHWFNPLAWRAFRVFRADQELANDARVLAGRSRADRHIYACAIVKAAHGGAIAATCHLHTISDLKGRLRMLGIARPSRTRIAAGIVAVGGLVATGLIVTASGTSAAAAITGQVERATGVALAAPAVPAIPTEPTPPAMPPVPAMPPMPAVARTGPAPRVVVMQDGRTRVYEGEAARRDIAGHPLPPLPPMPPMPPAAAADAADAVIVRHGESIVISNGDCSPESGPAVINRTRDGRRETIVCRNRLPALAADAHARARVAMVQADAQMRQAERQIAMAERQAAAAERHGAAARRAGLRQAMAGIEGARASIDANPHLSAAERRHALAGLDDAMQEVRSGLHD